MKPTLTSLIYLHKARANLTLDINDHKVVRQHSIPIAPKLSHHGIKRVHCNNAARTWIFFKNVFGLLLPFALTDVANTVRLVKMFCHTKQSSEIEDSK